MKRILALTLTAIFTLFLLTGCKSSGQQTTNMILATGGTSGTYYPFGGAMAQIWSTKIDGMNVTAQTTGASAENLRLLNSAEAELAIVQMT